MAHVIVIRDGEEKYVTYVHLRLKALHVKTVNVVGMDWAVTFVTPVILVPIVMYVTLDGYLNQIV